MENFDIDMTIENPRTERRSICYRIFLALILMLVVLLVLTIACFIKVLTLKGPDMSVITDAKYTFGTKDFLRYGSIFAESLRFETVSKSPGSYNEKELLEFQNFLINRFPVIFNNPAVELEIVNSYSMLLHIKGTDIELSPYLLSAHLDVVPVEAELWSYPPFSGQIIAHPDNGEEVFWGRGAIDVKASVLGILSALDLLFKSDWSPKRGFYVAFGHDEEVSGYDGAGKIGELLYSRNVTLDFLLDEGMPITQGVIKGFNIPIALIGVTEKGRMDIQVSTNGTGGHSSIPPKDQAIKKLVKALDNLYQNPQPSKFGHGPEKDMIEHLVIHAKWPHKFFMANSWLFGPVISYVLSLNSQSDALLRTTTSVTIIEGGIKENIIPINAFANVNHRIHPAQTLEEVLYHDKWSIADENVKLDD